ncbi:hypothetical protein AC249_AIPGENE19229 [Exaiptasia diaphana]|nr:hypothetical protein AC249_AIPGENE19229 [Exaiptasia diaphana]
MHLELLSKEGQPGWLKNYTKFAALMPLKMKIENNPTPDSQGNDSVSFVELLDTSSAGITKNHGLPVFLRNQKRENGGEKSAISSLVPNGQNDRYKVSPKEEKRVACGGG